LEIMSTTANARKITLRCPHCGTLNRVDLNRMADKPKCGGCGKLFLLDRPLKATQADFDATIGSAPVPVLVDFHADWCQPCHMLAPTLDAIAEERMGRALVLKVDTEADPSLATRFGIRGLPTVVVFKAGREAGRLVGVVPKQEIEKLLGS
jgi:thioredoxin 2